MKAKFYIAVLLALVLGMTPIAAYAVTTNVKDSTELSNALTNVNDGDTISLTDNVTLNATLNISNGKNFTLDLNTHKILYTGTSIVGINLGRKDDGTTLAPTNMTITGTGEISGPAQALLAVRGGSTLTVGSGVTISTSFLTGTGQTTALQNAGTTILNGATVKAVGTTANALTIVNLGALTINDGTTVDASGKGAQTLTLQAAAGQSVSPVKFDMTGGKLTSTGNVMAMTISDGNTIAYPAGKHIVANISGTAELTTSGEGAVIGSNGLYKTEYFELNIKGGTLRASDNTSESAGVYLPGTGVTNITGGTITGPSGIVIKSGELNISDAAVITATGDYDDTPQLNGNGFYPTGAAVQIEQNSLYDGGMKVAVSGGTLTSQKGVVIQEYQDDPATNKLDELAVSGGELSGAEGAISVTAAGNAATSITGGTFKGNTRVWVGGAQAFTITFKANDGGTTGDHMQIVPSNAASNVTLDANSFTRKGYSFDGWAESAAGEVKYADKGKVATVDKDMTLYAVWIANDGGGSGCNGGFGMAGALALLSVLSGARKGKK